MDDEKIFGPLTLRQFLYVAAGSGAAYLVYGELATAISVPLIAVIAAVTFVFVRRAAPPPFDARYIERKRGELGRENFERWAQMKTAMLKSQNATRAQKGLPVDPRLAEAEALIAAAINGKGPLIGSDTT